LKLSYKQGDERACHVRDVKKVPNLTAVAAPDSLPSEQGQDNSGYQAGLSLVWTIKMEDVSPYGFYPRTLRERLDHLVRGSLARPVKCCRTQRRLALGTIAEAR